MHPLLICVIVTLIAYYMWKGRRTYILSRQFRGNFAFPLIGNSHIFAGKNEDVLIKLGEYIKQFKGHDPLKFWMGPKLCVIFSDPNHVGKIMISQRFSHKMELYDIIKRFIGEGLVTASGPAYRQHKKVIVPLLDLNFTNSCYEAFKEFSNLCIQDLMGYCNKDTFNIETVIHHCFARTISRTIFGIELDVEKDHQFLEDVVETYNLGFTRLARPWLHPEIIYQQTSFAKKEDALMKRVHSFIRRAIDESWKRIKFGQAPNSKIKPLIDSLTECLEEQPDLMDQKIFIDHIYTLFLASVDTLTISSSFLCLCLGMYPEYQQKVADELRSYFGETPKSATLEDIGELPYLDMCIKETLRIVPIAPLILRKVPEECEIDGWTLPKGSAVLVPVFYIHRDRKFWENPDHFFPDHFLPEVEKERPANAYLPFSAGTRGCVGKVFANVNLRIFMATFLQRFEVEADGKLPDVKLRMDVSTRPVKGYNVRIKRRI